MGEVDGWARSDRIDNELRRHMVTSGQCWSGCFIMMDSLDKVIKSTGINQESQSNYSTYELLYLCTYVRRCTVYILLVTRVL